MDKKYLNPLIDLLKIKSVSTQPEYLPEMEKARKYLVDLFSGMGFKTKILKAKKHNAIFCELTTDYRLPTVLVYGHYDVQPPEPLNEWKTEPFEPVIKNGNLCGRGTNDNKGQFMVHVMAVKKLLETSNKPQVTRERLPVNFKFIIEGEEEIGSVSVGDLAKKYGKNLFKCDYLVVSDSEMVGKGQPSIDVSLRGLTYTEVHLEGSAHDMHSGQFGNLAENPANVLARVISKLKNEKGHVLIPGFYDGVISPTKEELADYKKVKTSEKLTMEESSLYGLGGGEPGRTINERRWSRPILDVNGLTSGFQGEGSKTIIPARASAKISMRLVPNQKPDKIFKLFEKYVKSLVPKNTKVKVVDLHGALTYKAPTTHPVFALMKQSLKKSFGKDPLFTGVGGTIGFIPIVAGALKVPCIMVGWGLPDDNLHAPNEHFLLENYFKGIETMVDFFTKLPSLDKHMHTMHTMHTPGVK